jgi:hypothetical protein
MVRKNAGRRAADHSSPEESILGGFETVDSPSKREEAREKKEKHLNWRAHTDTELRDQAMSDLDTYHTIEDLRKKDNRTPDEDAIVAGRMSKGAYNRGRVYSRYEDSAPILTIPERDDQGNILRDDQGKQVVRHTKDTMKWIREARGFIESRAGREKQVRREAAYSKMTRVSDKPDRGLPKINPNTRLPTIDKQSGEVIDKGEYHPVSIADTHYAPETVHRIAPHHHFLDRKQVFGVLRPYSTVKSGAKPVVKLPSIKVSHEKSPKIKTPSFNTPTISAISVQPVSIGIPAPKSGKVNTSPKFNVGKISYKGFSENPTKVHIGSVSPTKITKSTLFGGCKKKLKGIRPF